MMNNTYYTSDTKLLTRINPSPRVERYTLNIFLSSPSRTNFHAKFRSSDKVQRVRTRVILMSCRKLYCTPVYRLRIYNFCYRLSRPIFDIVGVEELFVALLDIDFSFTYTHRGRHFQANGWWLSRSREFESYTHLLFPRSNLFVHRRGLVFISSRAPSHRNF